MALSLALKHHNLGFALQTQGKLDEAVASYRRALTLKPDFAEPHNAIFFKGEQETPFRAPIQGYYAGTISEAAREAWGALR